MPYKCGGYYYGDIDYSRFSAALLLSAINDLKLMLNMENYGRHKKLTQYKQTVYEYYRDDYLEIKDHNPHYWIFEEQATDLCAFETCCHNIDIDPDWLRERIREWLIELGYGSYGKQQFTESGYIPLRQVHGQDYAGTR